MGKGEGNVTTPKTLHLQKHEKRRETHRETDTDKANGAHATDAANAAHAPHAMRLFVRGLSSTSLSPPRLSGAGSSSFQEQAAQALRSRQLKQRLKLRQRLASREGKRKKGSERARAREAQRRRR